MGSQVASHLSCLTGQVQAVLEACSFICINQNNLSYWAESDATLPPVVIKFPTVIEPHHAFNLQSRPNGLSWQLTKPGCLESALLTFLIELSLRWNENANNEGQKGVQRVPSIDAEEGIHLPLQIASNPSSRPPTARLSSAGEISVPSLQFIGTQHRIG